MHFVRSSRPYGSPSLVAWGLVAMGMGMVPGCENGSPSSSNDDDGDAETSTGFEWESLDERPCPDDSFLTYDNFGEPYLLSWCTGCHGADVPADMRQGAPVDVHLDSLDEARTWADRIWARAADQNATMPPVGPPGRDERELLGEWLACGAPP